MHPMIREFEQDLAKKEIDEFAVGDTVDVHVRIIEGEKERIQVFTGTVISRSGTGMNETFTVRRLVQGEGVERVFPLQAPRVEKVVSKRRGRKRRAKLYFLRDRVGKATRLREDQRAQVAGGEEPAGPDAGSQAAEAEAGEEA